MPTIHIVFYVWMVGINMVVIYMKSKKTYFFIILCIESVAVIVIGLFLYRYNHLKINGFKPMQIFFITLSSIILILTVIDSCRVFIKRRYIGKVLYPLKLNENTENLSRMIPSILFINVFVNLASFRSIYNLSISAVMFCLGAICITRFWYFPKSITENGLSYFGEIYNWEHIENIKMSDVDNTIEFKIADSFGILKTRNIIKLKFASNLKEELSKYIINSTKNISL